MEAYSKHGITAGSSLATRTVISQKLVNYLEDFWVDMVLQSDSQLTSCAATTQFPADFQFNLSHIITYFVTRCACDHQPTQDIKSMNKSAKYLFKCGHVQSIQFIADGKYLFF